MSPSPAPNSRYAAASSAIASGSAASTASSCAPVRVWASWGSVSSSSSAPSRRLRSAARFAAANVPSASGSTASPISRKLWSWPSRRDAGGDRHDRQRERPRARTDAGSSRRASTSGQRRSDRSMRDPPAAAGSRPRAWGSTSSAPAGGVADLPLLARPRCARRSRRRGRVPRSPTRGHGAARQLGRRAVR